MKAFERRDGWLWRCEGGPLDGLHVRMQAGKAPQPDDLPTPHFPLTQRPDGEYRLQKTSGTAVIRGRHYPKYVYRWEAT